MDTIYELVKFVSYMLLGLTVAYIAYQRLVTARNKLKLDLYNKRFSIYTDTLNFRQELIKNPPGEKAQKKFVYSKESSYHLFSGNREIYKLLDRIHAESLKVTGYITPDAELGDIPEGGIEMTQESMDALLWIDQQIPVLRNMMGKYLDQ